MTDREWLDFVTKQESEMPTGEVCYIISPMSLVEFLKGKNDPSSTG